ncbi:pentapeptide repeat-containing protein [Catellatospora sichuanensis]|uniref:pentapeptide repeat-containing protein n=1 Tax=Catellatospora sichuanensis TaxID=1969805 RepID=UPI0011837071|nr:pentapeptide repeat-containing protein [Catellatospora sichuanensis]
MVDRIQVQQVQAGLRDGVRSAMLQGAAGILVVIGAIAAWLQVRVGRESHVTGLLARAIDHVGSDNPDVRVGGIYTLERIARNSAEDRLSVMFLLATLIRRRVPWNRPDGSGTAGFTEDVDMALPWLRVRQPEAQTAIHVLSRRLVDPMTARLYLARTDLGGVQVNDGGRLGNANFNHANLARAWLQGVLLDHGTFKGCDLRAANLRRASLISADLRGASLRNADLRDADLRGALLSTADLRGTRLTGADLSDAVMDGVVADEATAWPDGFGTRGNG